MTKILVIEDEEAVRAGIIALLDAENFDTIGAENGQLGVQLAQEYLPDLILCDWMMPELSGSDVLNHLRQTPLTATIPFIFLTALAAKEDMRQGMDLGADDYITKPFTSLDLLSAIANRLEKQSALVQESETKLVNLRHSITFCFPDELLTLFQTILGLSESLIDRYQSLQLDEISEIASGIYTSAQEVWWLSQNFLLYIELEIKAADPEKVKVLRRERTDSLVSLLSEVALQKAQQAGREADLQLELQDLGVQISEFALKKIAEELIDNALKYSPIDTPIHIIGIPSINVFLLSIVYCDRGMTADEITNRASDMHFDRKFYFAKRLAELYDGKLTISSIPDQQTTVRVALPL